MTRDENEVLTRVARGTLMGDYLRSHWTPAVRSLSVEAGGAPANVRLFGENYVLFRNPAGQLGLLDESCPHRGVSLVLGRNEECGLRCLYHGWQFNTAGECVDLPNETPARRPAIQARVKMKSYPVKEKGGLVWVYLGEGEAPLFPNFEWLRDDVSHPPWGAIVQCNWLQTLEGSLDPDHVGTLHAGWIDELGKKAFSVKPSYEVIDRPYGFSAAAIRDLGPLRYVRVKEMVLPWYPHIPFSTLEPRAAVLSIPIDDETTYVWYVKGGGDREPKNTPSAERLVGQPEGTVKWTYMIDSRLAEEPDPDNFRKTIPYDPANKWGQDRRRMAEGHYSGIPSFLAEDFVIFEAMGKIQDRTKEHPVISDQFIIKLRRELLKAATAYAKGTKLEELDYSDVVAIAGFVKPHEDWKTLAMSDIHPSPAFIGDPEQQGRP